jgi:hypothetical protein
MSLDPLIQPSAPQGASQLEHRRFTAAVFAVSATSVAVLPPRNGPVEKIARSGSCPRIRQQIRLVHPRIR